MRPPSACRSRLVASSVATSAAVAVRLEGRPAQALASSAATRTSRTRVESSTGTSQTLLITAPSAKSVRRWPRQ